MYEWPDKALKEQEIARDFVKAYEMVVGSPVRKISPRENGQDPPDVELLFGDGGLVGLEITELVDHDAVVATERTGEPHFRPWSDQDLQIGITKLVTRKDRPGTWKGGPYRHHLLLIHTDEPLLTNDKELEGRLKPLRFTTSLLDAIYLMRAYDPQMTKNRVLRIQCQRQVAP